MKVILNEDVRKVGKKGQVVEVADGYGHNFLIARGLAVEATPAAMKVLADKRAADKRRDDKVRAEAEAASARLSGKVVRVSIAAGEGGKLFGAVTTAQVAEALKAQYDLDVEKKNLKIDGTVKALGSYRLAIKLHSSVEVSMTLAVVGAN